MFKSILFPVDGSPLSYRPMTTAVTIAKMNSAKLVVLSVAEPRLYNASDKESVRDGEVVEAINVANTKRNLQKIVADAKREHLQCEAVISVSRCPAEEILTVARKFDCDVIVMATRRKDGLLDQLFEESVTQEVLKKTHIPVLVCP